MLIRVWLRSPLRWSLFLTLAGAAVSIGLAALMMSYPRLIAYGSAGKWLNTAGLLLDVSGLVQLKISGLFEKILSHYGDEEEYPYGPPSFVTREIMEVADSRVGQWLYDRLFYETGTGFYLIVSGCVLQLIASW